METFNLGLKPILAALAASLLLIVYTPAYEEKFSPQDAFIVAFEQVLAEHFEFESSLPLARDIETDFEVFFTDKLHALRLDGYTAENFYRLASLIPGFDEIRQLLTTPVILDILGLPIMPFVMQQLFDEFAPMPLATLISLTNLFGDAFVMAILGDFMPSIYLFEDLNYFMGAGFVENLLEMDVMPRFEYAGRAFAEFLVSSLN